MRWYQIRLPHSPGPVWDPVGSKESLCQGPSRVPRVMTSGSCATSHLWFARFASPWSANRSRLGDYSGVISDRMSQNGDKDPAD
jgi:hypothetical protein